MADCHNDLLIAVTHQRERGHDDPFGDFWLDQLRAGGVVVQVVPICLSDEYAGEVALRRCLLMIEALRDAVRRHAGDVALVTTASGLQQAIDTGRIALVLAIEGAEPVGNDLVLLDLLAREGVRMASLTWNRRTMMGDGVGERDTGGRLTSLGVRAVQRMAELGVVVDVSHLSEAGFWHLADIAQAPYVASHSSCRAVHDHPRNLSDDQIRAIADSGGFVAINAYGSFLGPAPTIETYLEHVDHAVSLVGSDHVALGTDFVEDLMEVVDPVVASLEPGQLRSAGVPGLARPADLAALSLLARERWGLETATDVCSRTLVRHLLSALG